MSDFMNRTAGLGYARGALVLISGLAIVFAIWKVSGHSLNVVEISTFGGELLYWTAILFSNTLGTSLGDFLADNTGLGFGGGALVVGTTIALIAITMRFTSASRTLLFWMAFVLTRPLGATVGDFFSKPAAKGGLGFGTIGSSAALVALIVWTTRQQRRAASQHQRVASTLASAEELVLGLVDVRHADVDDRATTAPSPARPSRPGL